MVVGAVGEFKHHFHERVERGLLLRREVGLGEEGETVGAGGGRFLAGGGQEITDAAGCIGLLLRYLAPGFLRAIILLQTHRDAGRGQAAADVENVGAELVGRRRLLRQTQQGQQASQNNKQGFHTGKK